MTPMRYSGREMVAKPAVSFWDAGVRLLDAGAQQIFVGKQTYARRYSWRMGSVLAIVRMQRAARGRQG